MMNNIDELDKQIQALQSQINELQMLQVLAQSSHRGTISAQIHIALCQARNILDRLLSAKLKTQRIRVGD